MTRGELRARLGEAICQGIPIPTTSVHGRVLRGLRAYAHAFATWPTKDLSLAVQALRRHGVDLMEFDVSPCRWPVELPAQRTSATPPPAAPPFEREAVDDDFTPRQNPQASLRGTGGDFYDDIPNTAQQLIACRRETPLPAQERIVDEAIRAARGAGLRLPLFTIEWRDGKPGICAGAVERTASGRYTMFLSVNAWPDDLTRTCYHETQHLADFEAGLFEQMTRGELERRADMFAEQMLAGGR